MANIVSGALLQIKCPDELRELKAWVTWSYEQTPEEKAKGKKPRKVPYYANGQRRHGVQGTAEDRGRLVTFDQAKVAAIKAGRDGIGFVPQPEMNVVIIDFDDAMLSDGAMLPEVTEAIGTTYNEVSPSGRGVHAFFRGSFPNKKSHANAERFGVEVFCSSGFVTFTGQPTELCELVSNENTIAPLSVAMLQILSERFLQDGPPRDRPAQSGDAIGYSDEQLQEMLAAIDPGDDDYHAWLQVGMALHHETDGDTRGFELWDEWSQRGAKYEGREILEGKWDGFGRSPGAPVTIRSLVKLAAKAGASIGTPAASPDEFEEIPESEEEVAEKAERRARFEAVLASELLKLKPPGWLVKGLIPDAELIMVYGASGSGKSFVCIDLAMAIARGIPWFGRKTRQSSVVYVCAEGAGGFGKRLQAYAQQNGLDLAGVPLHVIRAAPNLLDKGDLKLLMEQLNLIKPQVVILDTFARVTPGANENAGEDMGQAIANCGHITRLTGARVLLVHHTGKDESRGARGWSGIKGALDAELEVVRDRAAGKRWIETTKEKDAPDDGRIGFSLETIVVGQDEDGDDITSCVIMPDQAPVEARGKKPVKKLKPWPAAVMEAMADLTGVTGQAVRLPELIAAAADKRPDAGEIRHRKANAKRAIEGLAKGKDALLIIEQGIVPVVLAVQE